MRIRQSLIRTWMSCPLQAKFSSIDQLPQPQNFKACFGTVIHYVLEQWNHDLDTEAAKELFLDLWLNPEKLGLAPEVMPKYTTYGGLRDKGIQIIEEFAGHYKWENRELIATEHQFLVPFGRHELTGTIDLLEVRKNHKGNEILRVVDFKTNSRKPTYIELQANTQFTVYTYASLQPEFWLGMGDIPGMEDGKAKYKALESIERRSIWYHLWTGVEMDAGTRDDVHFKRLYRVCNEIEKAIENDVFVPDISGQTCLFCPYHEPCGMEIPPQGELQEQEAAWL